MCGLGQSSPNPVLSTLRYFRDEYLANIIDKRCDAYVCKELVGAPCQAACPLGTEVWRYSAHIARGEYEEAYLAIRETNPFPSVCARVCDHQCELHCKLGTTGQKPLAIRALKRFVTDAIDPGIYHPARASKQGSKKVAIIGAGPAGLTAAHQLSLQGYKSTVFDAHSEPGGMLILGIPSYRLPRDILRREIAALIDDNITLKMNTSLGSEITIDQIFENGSDSVFLSLGSSKSIRLGIEGEDLNGVFPSMEFLSQFNTSGISLAKGHVGVIGGGNSALDAARTALRQPGVKKVTIIYRRTRDEMPAFQEEIDAAIKEGIILETLLSPKKILSGGSAVSGLECLRNKLGDVDASGRRRPVPVEGSEFILPLDTLIVAIGEKPNLESLPGEGSVQVKTTKSGLIKVDPHTMAAGRAGLFAGGDLVTGPNTVVKAIAAGKKAAVMIQRYFEGEDLRQPASFIRPSVYIEPLSGEQQAGSNGRPRVPQAVISKLTGNFEEIEGTFDAESARAEASNCLRCDLEFIKPAAEEAVTAKSGGNHQ